MYFGTTAFKQIQKPVVETTVDFGSVVYTEYLNRKSMLEACTDESQKSLLEAQVEILQEVSFKDIKEKVITAIHDFIEWIKKIGKKIKDFFTGAKYKAAQEEIERLKKELDSSEAQSKMKDIKIDELKNNLNKEQEEHKETKSKLNNIIDVNPVVYFNAKNYLVTSFSPQSMASCAYDMMSELNDKHISSENKKDNLKEWLDEYEKYLCILNDKTLERLGKGNDLSHGGIDHFDMNRIIREDIESAASKNSTNSLLELYKKIEITNKIRSSEWLITIMDGYEIFAQNLIKTVEKEFDVDYTQNVGNTTSYRSHDYTKSKDENEAKSNALKANELFQRANAAIKLCKMSVTACGTLIKFDGEYVGACRQLMRTIKSIIPD